MKKTFLYIFILLFAFVIVGCETSKKHLEFNEVTDIKLYKETNFEYNSIYERYNIINQKQINDFLLELNKIEYKKQKETNDILEYYDYIIILDNLHMILVIDDYFYISNDGINYTLCDIISNNFDFLDSIEFKLKQINANEFYTEDDLKTIVLENVNNNIIVDVTRNKNITNVLHSTKYYINDLEISDLKLQYIIHLSNEKGICVYEQGVIGFFDSMSIYDKAYKVLNNEFDILNTIVDSDIKKFNFENIEKIVVGSIIGSTEIKDISGFVNKINSLEYVKILDDSYEFHYECGIIIDDISIGVCTNNIFIVSKEDNEFEIEIYALNNCTFVFLSDFD